MGPKTAGGKSRSARNALKHGLSLPVLSCGIFSEEVETLAREIGGANASLKIHELARRIAEAQIDLRRISPRIPRSARAATGRISWQQFFPTWRSGSRPWTGMNGERCRGASLRFGLSMRTKASRNEAIVASGVWAGLLRQVAPWRSRSPAG